MKAKRFYSLLCLLLFLVAGAQADKSYFYFKRLGLERDLPSKIFSIYVDPSDFIWAGTKKNLVRIDDQSTVTYSHDANNPNSLPSGPVLQIESDNVNRMWVLTDSGVACYRPASDDFLQLKDEQGKNLKPTRMCRCAGGMAFMTLGGIYVYGNSGGRLMLKVRPQTSYSDGNICRYDANHLIYCDGTYGVRLVDCRTWKTRPVRIRLKEGVSAFFVDSRKRIWLSTWNKNSGLKCYDIGGRLIDTYSVDEMSLQGGLVLCMAERLGHLYVGTDGAGLVDIDPASHTLVTHRHQSGDDFYAIPANSVCSIYIDTFNNTWLGSVRNGLLCMRQVRMRTFYEVSFDNVHGLSNNAVVSFYEENPDKIWVGTDGGGINCFIPSREEFVHYRDTYDEKIPTICGLRPGVLLMRVYAKGIFKFNEATGTKEPFVTPNEETNEILKKSAPSAFFHNVDNEHILFLGDKNHVLNTKTSIMTDIGMPKEAKDAGKLHYISADSFYVYVFNSLGIFRISKKDYHFGMICVLRNGRSINSVSRDLHGNFWIGTDHGLYKFVVASFKLRPISTHLFEEVDGVVSDNSERVWVANENRIFAWFKKNNKFIVYGEMDGVLRNEFLPRVCLKVSNGDIYLGGTNGMLHIDRDFVVYPVSDSRLQLSSITVNGGAAKGVVGQPEPKLSVKWGSNISISVMSLEHNQFRQKLYRYLIKGLSDKYIETFDASLTMRSLPSGHYTILASVMKQDGTWLPWQKVLEVRMSPPWYRNLWFLMFCVVSVLLTIFYFSRRALHEREERMRWEANAHERQVNDDKMRFLVDITHELRTPLTLIHAPLDRLLKSMPTGNPYYSALKGLQRQTIRMKHLINMVLDVHRMETTETRLHMQPYNLNEWLRQVADDFATEGAAQGIDTVYDLDGRIGMLSFDKDKCDMVLNNLLGNALKHSSTGGHIYVRTKLDDDGTKVRISISDEGPGMKGVDPARLFQRFYQGGNETVGSGIGLSYSKILVEQHGGTIGAYNNEDVGATFFFELPFTTAAGEIVNEPYPYLSEMVSAEHQEVKNERKTSYDLSHYKLLVVDDNKALTDFLRDSLQSYFMEVNTASDGEEALISIRNNIPDVVVSDVMMPRKDGFELCKEIKENVAISHIVVILLTARDDNGSQTAGYKNGADAYLTKPFEIDTLLELLSNRLRSRQEARQRYMSAGMLPMVQENTFSSADESFMVHLDKIISDNIQNTVIDVPLLCVEMGMSRSALYKKLKAVTDMGPNDYITKYRMETAVRLMRTTDLSITDIADKVGVSSPRYFSTLFKHCIGEPPSTYRKKCREQTHE